MRFTLVRTLSRAALFAGVCGMALPAAAQDDGGEIVVTARKRAETLIEVPVSVTAFSAAQLDDMAIDSFADLSAAAPNLTVSQVSGGLGGSIHLRGVGTSAGSNASFEQTVAVNIDGVQLSRGSALRLGQIDMNRIEILRGPQALFFGKNSPAGVISITSQDAGDQFEVMLRAGYEANANERMLDAVVSGPLTETLRARVTLSTNEMDGWMDNQAPDVAAAANALVPNAVYAPIDEGPQQFFWMARGSLNWEPTSTFDVRAKLSMAELDGPGFQQGPNQRFFCPMGTPQVAGQVNALTANPATRAALTPILAVDDCTANDTYAHGSINPAHLANARLGKDARGLGRYELALGSIEANWQLSPSLLLTGVTGVADIEESRYDTYSYAPSSSVTGLVLGGITTWRQLSQEVRLASDFAESPFNFMIGGYVEDSELTTFIENQVTPGPRFLQVIDGSTYSAFGQGMFDLTESIELSGGVRWTREERDLAITREGLPQPVSPASAVFENVSPELTVSWRPSPVFTMFATYREGFKSGGFATPLTGGAAFTPPGPDYRFEPEEVDGFEIGLHADLLDSQLRINAAVYDYNYANLQVNSLDNSTGIPIIRVNNAAAASVTGAEFDFNWTPDAVDGLSIRGSVNYNDATFDRFDASCYIGQTQAMGCTLGLNATTGRFQAQSLAGRALPNASEWTGSVGASYEGALTESLGFMLSADTVYRSEYNPHPELTPGALQDEVYFVNAGARLFSNNRSWELGLVGRNLTEEYRVASSSNAPQSGSGALTGSTTPGGLADLVGYANRGREILLQLTLRPTDWGH